MRAILFAGVALFALAGSAQAQAPKLTGAQLMSLCANSDQRWVEACKAYLDGINQTVALYQRLRPQNGSAGGTLPEYICVPPEVNGERLRQLVLDWGRAHRDSLNDQGINVAIWAMRDRYKCNAT